MKTILIVILSLLVFIVMISFMNIRITIQFRHENDDDQLRITFRTFFGLIRYRVSVPLIQLSSQTVGVVTEQKQSGGKDKKKTYTPKDTIKTLKKVKEKIEQIVHLNVTIKKFLSNVSVTQFQWHTHVGTGDAAKTGMLVGLGWSLKYGIIGIISKYMRLEASPSIELIPHFQAAISRTEFICMIRFRIGYAILAGLRIVKHWKIRSWSANKVESY
ncbi:DUF2953 domain-containing protein [Thermolongibacillus altinsuensis]